MSVSVNGEAAAGRRAATPAGPGTPDMAGTPDKGCVPYGLGAAAGLDAETLGTRGSFMDLLIELGLPAPTGVTIPVGAAPALGDPGCAQMAVSTVLDLPTGGSPGGQPGLLRLTASAPVELAGLPPQATCLGLTPDNVGHHAAVLGRPTQLHAAWAATIRLAAEHALGIPPATISDVTLDVPDPVDQVAALLKICAAEGRPYPVTVADQVAIAASALLARWTTPRAARARKAQGLPADLGIALHLEVQPGGDWDRIGYGVATSRDAATGAFVPSGRFHRGFAASARTADDGEPLEALPVGRDQLTAALRALESALRGVVEVPFEYVDDEIRLFGARVDPQPPGRAVVAVSVELALVGAIDRDSAVQAVTPDVVRQLLHPRLQLTGRESVLARGLPASPGAARGHVALTSERAVELVTDGTPVILVTTETTPADLPGMLAAQAIVTSRGGSASHAAVVARGIGRPAVCGVQQLTIDHAARVVRAGDAVVREGDVVSVDGWSGTVYRGEVAIGRAEPMPELVTLLDWADGLRVLGIRANADTAGQTASALALGAEGVGLCRTEHQFLGERLPLIQRVLLAYDAETEERALRELGAAQREDFRDLLRAVGDRPVTVRLLDAPLHEFLPAHGEWAAPVPPELAQSLTEANPMMGVRGVRLAALHPGLYPAQARALFGAWLDVAAEGIHPLLEVMVPLVSTAQELRFAAALIRDEAGLVEERTGVALPYRIGTMVETPRAALLAGRLAEVAEFLSFGTNDLSQLTFGLSRDDVERQLMTPYLDQGLLAANPFVELDPDGVGELLSLAITRARAVRPDVKLGLCGEHGGDPGSVALCHRLGLDYVSCSPQRVSVARLAAAHAAMADGRTRVEGVGG